MTLKGYSAISVFWGKSGIHVFKSEDLYSEDNIFCQFTSLDFHIIPGGFCCLSGRKIYSWVSPCKTFENFSFYPVSRAVPTGVLRQGVKIIQINGQFSNCDSIKAFINVLLHFRNWNTCNSCYALSPLPAFSHCLRVYSSNFKCIRQIWSFNQ